MSLAAGTKLGPYEVLSQIGSGGMGEVWKALDTRLNRMVAIKKIKSGLGDRFDREARAVAALNHPYICQIYDVGPDYLVLEYIEGKPLHGPLAVEEAVRIAIQIASALEEAHAHGILHRDLKPGNILLTVKGTVKLVDFGLARMDALGPADAMASASTATMTGAGVVMGTLAYMSPEQAQGQPLDARSDIFSFGMVLYHMISGRRAFAGDTLLAVLTALLKEDPPPLAAPPALERIVRRCLAKTPADRFQTISEVRSALGRVEKSGGARDRPESTDEQPSIAVLPFANMSGDKEQEYFSDGLAEEIINELAQLRGLKVTARTSAFAFRGKEQDITRIAEALRVSTILEGSVRRAGNRIRVTAQLINAADGYHLWSQRYDREMEDVFAVQDEIAHAIASTLQVKLSLPAGARHRYTPKLPAYEAYLKGRHYFFKFTPDSMTRSQACFREAIALDPDFALPHCELAQIFFVLAGASILPAHTAMPQAMSAARNALQIDSSLPEAHVVLGGVAALYNYDWKEAERHFAMVMVRETVPPLVRAWYAYNFLLGAGCAERAVQEFRHVVQEDPVNTLYRTWLGVSLFLAERVQEAIAELRRVLELEPGYLMACGYLSECYASVGMQAEVKELLDRESLAPLAGMGPDTFGYVSYLHARVGYPVKTEDVAAQLGTGEAYGAPNGWMWFHLAHGNLEEAANWIEKGIEQRHPALLLHLRGPLLKPIRESPRWSGLAKKMNLPGSDQAR